MAKPCTAPDPTQLALFEEPVPVEPVAAPAPSASIDAVEAPPAVPIASILAPALFRHPQATREIRLDEHVIGYALRRVRRRSIGFVVSPEGLAVSAPKWIGLGDIEDALREKGRWILRKLREQKERQQRLQQARVDWRDGTSIPFLGEPAIVVLDPRATGAVLHAAQD